MRKKIFATMFMILLLSFLSACRDDLNEELNVHFPEYTGAKLTIGLVGDPPEIRENNVTFIPFSLNDVKQRTFDDVDAVFINEEYLPEAAAAEYAEVYLTSSVPFVFVKSKKVYLAFIDPELSYEDAHTSQSGDYFIGYFNDVYFGLSLYNRQETPKTIQACYSRLFSMIERAKQTGEISVS